MTHLVNPHDVEERAYNIDLWARRVIRRASRGSTSYILTPADDAAIKLLNATQRDYILLVGLLSSGGDNYDIGDDVYVAVRRRWDGYDD